jgi:hypothetical protein
MNQLEKILYAPALRMKAGELTGLRELTPDVAQYVVPRFIVPPLEERNENQADFFSHGVAPDVGGILGKFWQNRRAFVDLTYLIEEVGRDNLIDWLPQIFSRARSLKARGIPMLMLRDFAGLEMSAFKAAIPNDEDLKFAICVSSGELVSADLREKLNALLAALGLSARSCAIITDFSDSDFSLPDLVEPVIRGALELLQDVGEWQNIIFQGTHYPEINPAEPGQDVLCPRNEWEAWRQAVKFDPTTGEQMTFGDYAADSSKITFGSGAGRAIRHYRYTTPHSWLIVRGVKNGTDKEVMMSVCRRIIANEHFAGPQFSEADAYIYRTAHDLDGPGNSTMWRQVNTTHHITRVVTDVAKVRGIAIAEIPQEIIPLQLSLIE